MKFWIFYPLIQIQKSLKIAYEDLLMEKNDIVNKIVTAIGTLYE